MDNNIWLLILIVSLCAGFFFAGYRMNVVAIDVKYNNMCYAYVYEHCNCQEAKIRLIPTENTPAFPDVNQGFNWSYDLPYTGEPNATD
jgi:hypothetical protein